MFFSKASLPSMVFQWFYHPWMLDWEHHDDDDDDHDVGEEEEDISILMNILSFDHILCQILLKFCHHNLMV